MVNLNILNGKQINSRKNKFLKIEKTYTKVSFDPLRCILVKKTQILRIRILKLAINNFMDFHN